MRALKDIINQHRALWLIWLLFILLGITYNLSLPVFEAPDEFSHFRFIHWLATERRIPDMVENLPDVGHEIWQPPLYYAVVAPFVASIKMDDLYTVAPFNPDWPTGAGISVHFHNETKTFPYRNTTLAVHVARFISTLIGSIAVICAYGLARLISPGAAVLAAALVAFNPQFLFISAAVSNDGMAAALGGMGLWLLVWVILQPGHRILQFILLGFIWGLLTLTKLSGLAFGGLIVAGLVLILWRQQAWLSVIMSGLAALTTAALTAGWWFWRNWYAYGDPLAWQQMLAPMEPLFRTEAMSWAETFTYASFLRFSYWAMFGYGVSAPILFYWFIWSIALVAVVGLAVWLWQHSVETWQRGARVWLQPQNQAVFLLILWSAVVFASLIRWMRLLTDTNQGRLLFPAVVSLAVLFAIGLKTIGGQAKWSRYAILGSLIMWAAALPWLVIQPAYAQPKPLPPTAILPNPSEIQFGDKVGLIGFELSAHTVKPGEIVMVDLYWGALANIDQNYQVNLRLLDVDWHAAAHLAAVPYQGRYATPIWKPGEFFLDRYTFPPVSENAAPGLGRIVVSLHHWNEPEKALPVTINGVPVGDELTIANLKIAPLVPPRYRPEQEINITFAQEAILLGYDAPETAVPGASLPLVLYWQAVTPSGQDYTVFIHLLDATGNLIAQADGPPQQNRYPTSIWESGEQIKDERILHLPSDLLPGSYQLVAGLYHLESGQRLLAHSKEEGAQPTDRANLIVINIR